MQRGLLHEHFKLYNFKLAFISLMYEILEF